jgi:plasmid stabilization system protein ParE
MIESPILLPEAKADVANAFRWYEEQSMGLGLDFLRCVETALYAIQRTPLGYPTVHQSYRRSLVRRFPFAIFFEFVPEHNRCVIYAVFHCSQNPAKWMERLPA